MNDSAKGNGAIPPFSLYLFDVDGTLLDSAEDICGAVIEALNGTACLPATPEALKRFVGLHLIDTFLAFLPGATPEQLDALIAKYRAVYPARGHKRTRPYAGVAEALAALPGRKSTATTKASSTTRAILEQFGLLPYFDHVQGTDGFPYKPAPDVVLKSVELFKVRPEDVLFVGDSAPDMEAGRRAGVRTAAVTYGYGDHAEMRRWEPDYWIDDLRQLLPRRDNAGAVPGRLARLRYPDLNA